MAATLDCEGAPVFTHYIEDLSDLVDGRWLRATGRNGLGLFCIPDAEIWIIFRVVDGRSVFQCKTDIVTLASQSAFVHKVSNCGDTNCIGAARSDGAIQMSQCCAAKQGTEKHQGKHPRGRYIFQGVRMASKEFQW